MNNKKLLLIFSLLLVLALAACGTADNNIDVHEDVDNTSNSTPSTYTEPESPYTEDELKSNPSAPSTNINDYNSDGQYVPEDGPTSNPGDYNVNGDYKPVEDMTQEEIKAELKNMLNGN